ncbi:hypothetical protein V8C34DRAFT_98680 [Trichoderma compactum]
MAPSRRHKCDVQGREPRWSRGSNTRTPGLCITITAQGRHEAYTVRCRPSLAQTEAGNSKKIKKNRRPPMKEKLKMIRADEMGGAKTGFAAAPDSSSPDPLTSWTTTNMNPPPTVWMGFTPAPKTKPVGTTAHFIALSDTGRRRECLRRLSRALNRCQTVGRNARANCLARESAFHRLPNKQPATKTRSIRRRKIPLTAGFAPRAAFNRFNKLRALIKSSSNRLAGALRAFPCMYACYVSASRMRNATSDYS